MLQAEQPHDDDPMAYSAPSHMAEVSLLEDDENTSMLGGDARPAARHNSDSSLGWRERLERFKQQASAKFDELTKGAPAAANGEAPKQEISVQDLQKAVDETIEKLTDPLYTQIDFEQSLAFVDDIKVWSAAFPAVLPIVVSRIDKRMHTEHPQITYLALHLIDFLVKNASYLQFHKAVATNPLMNTVASIAKGSVVPQTSTMSTYMKRLQHAMPAELKTRDRSNSHSQTSTERAASIRAATLKAKEVVKCWGEGFTENQAELPLFHETLQRLMREGVDFGNVEVQGQIAFESTDLQAHFAFDDAATASRTSGAGASETITGANDTVQLYAEVKNGGDAALLEMVTAQVKAQQQELQSVIEISISTGDETTLLSALAAHESLQEALDGKTSSDTPAAQEKEQPQQQQPTPAPPAPVPETKSTVAADLLDLDFLSAAPAPAAPTPASTQAAFPPAPPAAMPVPAPVAAPAPVVASLDPFAPAPAAVVPPADDDEDDLFGDLVLTRKTKKQGTSA